VHQRVVVGPSLWRRRNRRRHKGKSFSGACLEHPPRDLPSIVYVLGGAEDVGKPGTDQIVEVLHDSLLQAARTAMSVTPEI
jgi:hypothetical protein